jgi:hypothetical protein
VSSNSVSTCSANAAAANFGEWAGFLALFNGAADEAGKAALSEQLQTEFNSAWASWAQANEGAIVDPGAPLNARSW